MSVWLCACSRREIGRLPSPLLLDLPPDIRDASKCRWSGYPSGDGYQHPAASAITASLPDRREDRKSVVEGKGVSVRVDLGGSRIIKKKTSKKRAEKQ